MSADDRTPEQPPAGRQGSPPAELPAQPAAPLAAQVAPASPSPPPHGYPIKRSVARVLGFSVLSFGLYTFYWFHVTREELKHELRSDDNAALQTAGLLVPILNYVITYWLWRDINAARRWLGLPEFSIPLYLVLSILGLAPIFYSLVVTKLNEYWDRRTGGHAVDAPITTAEKVVVVVGALIWVLYVLLIVLVIFLVVSSETSGSF